jgi:small-conductance mechanosensitive channel
MLGGIDTVILVAATTLVGIGFVPRLRLYRRMIWGGAALAVIFGLYPRPGNELAFYLHGGTVPVPGRPAELLGVASWILGAWLVKSLLNVILRRTIFPNDNQPHARRLFADLASGLVYVIAFVGIMDTVLKESLSTVLATSGVLAIVLGLALQNTLSDVFSGLAINVERPFGAGDWITLIGDVEGQVIEINWRATRIRTLSNDIIVIPNSVVAKAAVTNHRPLSEPNFCTIDIRIDQDVPVSRAIDWLIPAAATADGIAPASKPVAYARAFADTLIAYDLSFAVADFSQRAIVRSAVILRVSESMQRSGIAAGAPETVVRILRDVSQSDAPDSNRGSPQNQAIRKFVAAG